MKFWKKKIAIASGRMELILGFSEQKKIFFRKKL